MTEEVWGKRGIFSLDDSHLDNAINYARRKQLEAEKVLAYYAEKLPMLLKERERRRKSEGRDIFIRTDGEIRIGFIEGGKTYWATIFPDEESW